MVAARRKERNDLSPEGVCVDRRRPLDDSNALLRAELERRVRRREQKIEIENVARLCLRTSDESARLLVKSAMRL